MVTTTKANSKKLNKHKNPNYSNKLNAYVHSVS